MNRQKVIDNLRQSLFPYSFPEIAQVNKVYEGSGEGKYCCDVEILIPGSLEKTDEVIAEVPINPIWATKNKAGIYAMPEKDMIVIVGFIRGNRAFPYIQGIYGNQYETADFKKDEFLITDGDKQKITLKKDIIIVENGDNIVTIDNTSGSELIEIEDKSGNTITLDMNGIKIVDANNNEATFGSSGIKLKTSTTTLDLGSLIELKNAAGGLKGSLSDIWGELSGLATAIVTFAGLVAAISYAGPGALVNTTGGGIADLAASIGTIEAKAALVSGIFK